MGCLSYKLTRVGCGMNASLTGVGGGISASLSRVGGGIEASLTMKDGGISANFKRVGGMSCRMGLICTPNISHPYLEINPEIIWVYPDWSAYNDVISNTHWNVD